MVVAKAELPASYAIQALDSAFNLNLAILVIDNNFNNKQSYPEILIEIS